MDSTSLKEIYRSIDPDVKTIYVVPLIRFDIKESDYLYLLYEDLIKETEYDIQPISVFHHFKIITGLFWNRRKAILHYHWLEFQDFKSLSGMPWKLFCIYMFHKLGGSIVWTLHNEFPHDQKYLGLHRYLHKKMASWAKILHVHCKTAAQKMKQHLEVSEDKFRLIPHPKFPAYPIPQTEAIDSLNETYHCQLKKDQPILLMFGNISRYKQIERVADIIIDKNFDCRLMVVGPIKKGNQDLYEELREKSQQSEAIALIPKFIPEEHLPWFYSAADYCIFHYREILSSGGFHMAEAYDKKILAPNKGCLSEENSDPNVELFSNETELKQLLSTYLNTPKNAH